MAKVFVNIVIVKFHIQAWPLPPTEQEMAEGAERFKWFGRFVQPSAIPVGC